MPGRPTDGGRSKEARRFLKSHYSKVRTVGAGADAVDIALINIEGVIIVTFKANEHIKKDGAAAAGKQPGRSGGELSEL